MAFYCEVSFPLPLLQTFTYRLPESLVDMVEVGSRVLAPFGSRQLTGYVLEIKHLIREPDFKVKEIIGLKGKDPWFSESFVFFIRELARRNLVAPGQLLDLAEMFQEPEKKRVEVILTAAGQAKLDRGEIKSKNREILELLKGRSLSPVYLKRKTGLKNLNSYLQALKKEGLVEIREKLVKKRKAASKRQLKKPAQLQLPLDLSENPENNIIIKKVSQKEPGEFLVAGPWPERARYFVELIGHLLKQDGYIFILVPEIQRMRRWQELLDHLEELALLHSQITPAQYREVLERINSGQARLILGTRSLVLRPVQPVSLIIVDEEQDELYHQAEGVPFDAKEAARLRSANEQAVLVLTSSCPEVSSYFRHLTSGSLIDVTQEVRKYDGQIISGEADKILKNELKDELKDQVEKGRPVFIYVNKKGYAGYVQCARCHHVPKCPNCQIALSSAKPGKELYCRYCGETYPWPEQCPVCGQKIRIGRIKGSQFFREEMSALFPGRKVVVLEEGSEHLKEGAILKAITGRKVAAIIGTKYSLPRLWPARFSMVVVVKPEVGLTRPDFRAAETVFEDISQAAELVTNEEGSRLVVITERPEDLTIRQATYSDYKGFYEREIEVRKLLNYPPFCPLVNLNLSGAKMRSSARLSRDLLEQIENNFPEVEVIGPKVTRQAWHRVRKEICFYLRFRDDLQVFKFLDFLHDFKLRHSSARMNLKTWS